MKRYRALLTAALTAALAAAAFTAVHARETQIEFTINNAYMKVNGVSAEIDPGKGTAPVIRDGRTLLPIRAVVEAMGGEVEWKADTKTTVLKKDGNTVELTIGSNTAYLNGQGDKIDTAPVIINGRTMLPLRYVAESFGFKTDWDADTKSITITAGEKAQEELAYDNSTFAYTERRGTDGKIYSVGYQDIYILDKDKKPVNRFEETGVVGTIYTDDAGSIYMLTIDYENETYNLEGKDGKKINIGDIKETMVTVEGTGSDGLTYKELGMGYMYAFDKNGKVVKTFTHTREQDKVYTDKDGNKLLYITAKNGGPDDYVSYSGGSAMLERAYFTTYLGSDGLTYTWANDYLISLDDNFEPVKEYVPADDYNLISDDKNDDVYTMHYIGMMSARLVGPDDEETILSYEHTEDQDIYKDSEGNVYRDNGKFLEKLDKKGNVVGEFSFMAYCVDYTDKNGETYTVVYGEETPTLIMPSGKTVTFMETYG